MATRECTYNLQAGVKVSVLEEPVCGCGARCLFSRRDVNKQRAPLTFRNCKPALPNLKKVRQVSIDGSSTNKQWPTPRYVTNLTNPTLAGLAASSHQKVDCMHATAALPSPHVSANTLQKRLGRLNFAQRYVVGLNSTRSQLLE